MKKIIITIPLILLIVLSCIPCISASAKRVYDEVEDGYTEEEVGSFAPSAVDFDGSYFWFHTFIDLSMPFMV